MLDRPCLVHGHFYYVTDMAAADTAPASSVQAEIQLGMLFNGFALAGFWIEVLAAK